MENKEIVKEKELNFFQKIVGLFYKPTEVFKDIKKSKSVTLPIITLILFGSIVMLISFKMLGSIVLGNELDLSNVYGLRMDYLIYGILMIMMPVSYGIALLFQTVEFLVVSRIFKGKGSFSQYIKYSCHILIFSVIGTMVVSILCFVLKTVINPLSLSIIFRGISISSIGYKMLEFINVFGIWGLFLSTKAISEEEGFNNKKQWCVFGVLAIISLIITMII